MLDFLTAVMVELKKYGPLEPGDQQSFILDDAVVMVGLSEKRDLRIEVCVGPIRLEGVRTGLLASEEEG